jgi:hypothetical protein
MSNERVTLKGINARAVILGAQRPSGRNTIRTGILTLDRLYCLDNLAVNEEFLKEICHNYCPIS